jgi:hypothetical protein
MEAEKIIEHNWKLYEANEHLTDKLTETREKTDAFAGKWLMTLAPELAGFVISSLRYTLMVAELDRNLPL